LNRLNKIQFNLILFTICVLSRAITSIYYIEDIDSLRFALGVQDYSVINLQPHFPGYPIFIFFAKIVFFFSNSLGITFSVMGGISIFIIIHFTCKLARIELNSLAGLFCSAIIFFNPLLWLLSNRYMPDIFGAAIMVAALYFLIFHTDFNYRLMIGAFLTGILAGTRLSYLPVLIVPAALAVYNSETRIYFLYSFVIGIIVWLLPFIWVTGWDDLLLAASNQTIGHFTDFGGTSFTENNWSLRFKNFSSSIWADGFGGYLVGRHWLTLILSTVFIFISMLSANTIIKDFRSNDVSKLLFYSLIVYTIWILFFQNVIYKSRHVIPIVIVLLYFLAVDKGTSFYKNRTLFTFSSFYIITLVFVSIILVNQHKSPSAISKLKDHLISMDTNDKIVCIPLVKYYLETHGINATYIDVKSIDKNKIPDTLNGAIVIGNQNGLFNDSFQVISDSSYFHNPYVNRMWSEIHTFRLSK
tara:strand:+ start:220 stop:1629 length:1410 start_codon:yes stop_codon:yes gene_type:complete